VLLRWRARGGRRGQRSGRSWAGCACWGRRGQAAGQAQHAQRVLTMCYRLSSPATTAPSERLPACSLAPAPRPATEPSGHPARPASRPAAALDRRAFGLVTQPNQSRLQRGQLSVASAGPKAPACRGRRWAGRGGAARGWCGVRGLGLALAPALPSQSGSAAQAMAVQTAGRRQRTHHTRTHPHTAHHPPTITTHHHHHHHPRRCLPAVAPFQRLSRRSSSPRPASTTVPYSRAITYISRGSWMAVHFSSGWLASSSCRVRRLPPRPGAGQQAKAFESWL
jgi:hypothetical protein